MPLNSEKNFDERPHQTRYLLIDKDGTPKQIFYHATAAAEYAKHRWPDQQHDPERSGVGWDIEVVNPNLS